MKRFFRDYPRQVASMRAALLAAVNVLVPRIAQATPYPVINFQRGTNAVAIGAGELNLIGFGSAERLPPIIRRAIVLLQTSKSALHGVAALVATWPRGHRE